MSFQPYYASNYCPLYQYSLKATNDFAKFIFFMYNFN